MASSKFPIQKVTNNKEKGVSYKENFKRYNKAKASEFYLECLWILYAMLEDRSSAFLYYLGFTKSSNRNSVTTSKKIKPQVRQILNITGSNVKYKFDTISGKLARILDVIEWSQLDIDTPTDYQLTIRKAIVKIQTTTELVNALTYLNDEWRDKRNQLTHSLFNKEPQMVLSELKPLVEKGYIAARVLDKAVRQLKNEKIREQFKLK